MTHLLLSCPQCQKPLTHVPLDGLTLQYRCDEHGALILQPLVLAEPDDELATSPTPRHHHLPACDAA